MKHIPLLRRIVLCVSALGASTLLLHGQISSAIISRGDEEVYRSQNRHALALYARALFFDPDSEVAADRFVFTSLLGHRPRRLQNGLVLAARYLRRKPEDAVVLMDRAMLYEAVGKFELAERDFINIARREHSGRAYTFAGYAALRAGRPTRATELWRRALTEAPRSALAERALERHKR